MSTDLGPDGTGAGADLLGDATPDEQLALTADWGSARRVRAAGPHMEPVEPVSGGVRQEDAGQDDGNDHRQDQDCERGDRHQLAARTRANITRGLKGLGI